VAEVILLGDVPAVNAARLGAERWAVRHGEEVLTWGELASRALRRAHALAEIGVGKDDFVVLALPNGNAFFEWTYAIWKLGATPMAVSYRLPAQELTAVIAAAEAKYIVAHAIAEYDPGAFGQAVILPADFGRNHTNTEPLPSQVSKHWKAITSGGSTGRPKVIVDNNPSAFPVGISGLMLPKDGVMLNPAPLYHNFPFAMTHLAMLNGTSVVGMTKFDSETLLQLIDRHQVEWVNLVPTMMSRIARLPEEIRLRYHLSSLQTLWHTAAPIPPWLKEFWIEWLGPERIWEMYGGTEGFCATQLNGAQWLAHRGSVGRVVSGEIRIVGDAGENLAPGEVGEIFMRGPYGDTPSYQYRGGESRRTADGFESFGDFGWLDEDGFLYIADRRTDLILSGGVNLYPAEIESALMAHPAVETAIVIGLPDDDKGAVAHAILKLEAGAEAPTVAAMIDFAAQQLVSYKIPKSFEFTTEPLRDEAGKVRRSQLREARVGKL